MKYTEEVRRLIEKYSWTNDRTAYRHFCCCCKYKPEPICALSCPNENKVFLAHFIETHFD